jgi:predicted phage terminase large subunit-like protein
MWDVVLEKAIRDDGSLLFPERLSLEFLETIKRTQGSYIFANQYMNEVFPDGETPLKKEWLRYYQELPTNKFTFCFVDPAISTEETADFTGIVVIDCDSNKDQYLRFASRFKITPSEIINKIFEINDHFKPQCIGIEDVAYQKALLYMIDGEMRRRNKVIPVTGVRPGSDRTKEMRILSLVPLFEWGRIKIAQGLHDFEKEYSQFPKGAHDDVIDALSLVQHIAFYPDQKGKIANDPNPNSKEYESWYIRNLLKERGREDTEDAGDY